MDQHHKSEAPVSVGDLSVAYRDVVAVDSVSFDVGAGEVFGLLGPNGAGKTSVIRALTTIVKPSGGSAAICGFPMTRPTEVRRHIGVLPESNGYPAPQSALAYLTFYGQLFGQAAGAAGERARELLDRFGLSEVRAHQIGTFSRGMRQRLGIARALMNRPRVLFLDEPTIGLDPAGREDVLAHLVLLARQSEAAVIICSHLLDDMERICDRLAIMHEGRLRAIGTVDELASGTGVVATGLVEVAPAQAREVVRMLAASSIDCTPRAHPTRAGEVSVEFGSPPSSANELATILLDHGVDIRRLELRSTRLSDAFHAYTVGSRP